MTPSKAPQAPKQEQAPKQAPKQEQAPEQAPEQITAPEQAPEQITAPQAPEQEHALNIASAVALEEIAKATRVFVDVPGCPRVPTPEGTLAVVQRERRADDSLGEFMLAEIRKSPVKGQADSVQRYSLARVQALKSALERAGVTTLN